MLLLWCHTRRRVLELEKKKHHKQHSPEQLIDDYVHGVAEATVFSVTIFRHDTISLRIDGKEK
jgi:hypothetical protein